jgi:hypothetical protein
MLKIKTQLFLFERRARYYGACLFASRLMINEQELLMTAKANTYVAYLHCISILLKKRCNYVAIVLLVGWISREFSF